MACYYRLFIIFGFFLIPTFSHVIDASAQSVHLDLGSSSYYNMDTTKIVLADGLKHKESYSSSEVAEMLAGWDPDSTMDMTPCGNLFCGHVGAFKLPLMKITDRHLKRQVSKIIKKTIAKGYSRSPDTVISQGFFLLVSSYMRDSALTIQVNAISNYYMGDEFEGIKRNHPDLDVFVFYFKNILGIVSCENDTVKSLVKNCFSETREVATIHVYRKHCEILMYGKSERKDVHSTEYGLYRRFKLKKSKWVESY